MLLHWSVMPRACHRFLSKFIHIPPSPASIQDREPVRLHGASLARRALGCCRQRQNPGIAIPGTRSIWMVINQHLIARAAGTGQRKLSGRQRRIGQHQTTMIDHPYGYREMRAHSVCVRGKCRQPQHQPRNSRSQATLEQGVCMRIPGIHGAVIARVRPPRNRTKPQTHPDLSRLPLGFHPKHAPIEGSTQYTGTRGLAPA